IYQKVLTLRPDDRTASEALEKSRAKRSRWQDLVERYLQESQGAGEPSFRSSLLTSAAETLYRYGRSVERVGLADRILPILKDALDVDPKNRRAEALFERTLRAQKKWKELVAALERYATEATHKEEKTAAWVRLGR